MNRAWKAVLGKTLLLPLVVCVYASAILADPIAVDFNKCQTSVCYNFVSNSPPMTTRCCPATSPSQPVVDGLPTPSTSYTRIRMAAQCTDLSYAAKLDKAYQLMRALPDDDPRSLMQQWIVHCAYCGGAFYRTAPIGADIDGIDIHFSWLFYPWHRLFLYFHERILQSLLGDPSFSLSYWNWDNPFTVGNGHSANGACLQAGNHFPAAYASTSSAAYNGNRSLGAMGYGRLNFPDFTFHPGSPASAQQLYNATPDAVVQSNLNSLHQAMVSGGTTAETFMARPYRVGDPRVSDSRQIYEEGGTLEQGAHSGVHAWTGSDALVPHDNKIDMGIDMGSLTYAARDPVFYAHHSNMDRMFKVWKDIGPELGQNRQYYSDPDFLNATFLFYDETKTLRRVKVSDGLTTEGLGYTYQSANDAAWIHHKSSRCSTMDYNTLIEKAKSFPAPVKQADGYYHLQAGVSFITIIDQPLVSLRTDQHLVIDGIKMNPQQIAGFDVYLNLLDPKNYTSPTACCEYLGRFMHMKQSSINSNHGRLFTWKVSISDTLSRVQVPASSSQVVERVVNPVLAPPSQVVVTIVPLLKPGEMDTIMFSSISITHFFSS